MGIMGMAEGVGTPSFLRRMPVSQLASNTVKERISSAMAFTFSLASGAGALAAAGSELQ